MLAWKNEKNWKANFEKTAAYICTLKSNTGKPVLQSERYATFLGIDKLYDTFSLKWILILYEIKNLKYGFVQYLHGPR